MTSAFRSSTRICFLDLLAVAIMLVFVTGAVCRGLAPAQAKVELVMTSAFRSSTRICFLDLLAVAIMLVFVTGAVCRGLAPAQAKVELVMTSDLISSHPSSLAFFDFTWVSGRVRRGVKVLGSKNLTCGPM